MFGDCGLMNVDLSPCFWKIKRNIYCFHLHHHDLNMEYAHPEVLVDTQWVEDHSKDTNVRIAEVEYDPKANYHSGHVPGAVLFDWKEDINDPTSRNILSRDLCERLLQQTGINDDSTTIGSQLLRFGFKYYGYKDVRLMNGGRKNGWRKIGLEQR
jgi:thiosulfate/3-mercaptopyruvate sulfurtransferase